MNGRNLLCPNPKNQNTNQKKKKERSIIFAIRDPILSVILSAINEDTPFRQIIRKGNMSQLFIEDYIKKLVMLEKQLGTKTKYQLFEPFPLNPSDPIAIQDAAKKIAEFVGLHNLTFIVGIAKQKEKVGGHVELQYGRREVFIEISENIAKFDAAVLATLAHEITHKYLQINNISVGTSSIHEYENEVLTDITAVFLGLGKLMLNGCEIENVRLEARTEGAYVTEQLKSGYLDREQLAFVYRMVCAMRRISNQDMVSGLSAEALSAIRAYDSYQQDYFSQQLHSDRYRSELIKAAETDIQALQSELNLINQHLEFLKEEYICKTEEFLITKHKKVQSLLDDTKSMRLSDTHDPCLLFLSTIELQKKIDQVRTKVAQESSNTMNVKQSLNELTKLDQEKKFQESGTKLFLKKLFPRIFS